MSSKLDLFEIDRFPNLISNVKSVKCKRITEAFSVENTNLDNIGVCMLSGNVKLRCEGRGDSKYFFELSETNFFSTVVDNLILEPINGAAEFIIILFSTEVYTSEKVINVNIPEYCMNYDKKTRYAVELLNEYISNSSALPIAVNTAVSQLIISLYADYKRVTEETLSNVSAVSFFGTTPYDSEPIDLKITDIKFVLKNPSIGGNENGVLETVDVGSCYVEQPVNRVDSFCTQVIDGRAIGKLTINPGNYYKYWFFCNAKNAVINYKNICRNVNVSFSAMCNRPIRVVMGIYNIKTYRAICKDIDISDENKWNTYEFPMIGSFIRHDNNTYSIVIMNYIKDHYAEKLTVSML